MFSWYVIIIVIIIIIIIIIHLLQANDGTVLRVCQDFFLPLTTPQFMYLPTTSRRTAFLTNSVRPIIRVQVYGIKWRERTNTPKPAEPSPENHAIPFWYH